MKAKWLGNTEPLCLTHGKVYEILSKEYGLYRVVDDSDEDYLYDAELFEITEGSEEDLRKAGKIIGDEDNRPKIREAFLALTEEELSFLAADFSADRNWIESASEQDLSDLYDKVGFIEADEIEEAGISPLSARGELASSVVTKVGEVIRTYWEGRGCGLD